MPYFQTKQGGDVTVALSSGTTGGAAIGIPNFGITQISATSAEQYVLNPPVAGVEKTLVFSGYSTSALPIVKLCTNAADNIIFLAKTTNLTCIKTAAGLSTVSPTVVQLKGISSTMWMITNVFPANVTTGTTAVAVGISLTST